MGDDWAKDLVLVDDGRVVTFRDAMSARKFALAASLRLAPDEPTRPQDLDAAAAWISDGADPDLTVPLSIWNLAGDVARSVQKPLADRGGILDAIYDKVFFGDNLPAVTPPGERFEPDWHDEEVSALRRIIDRAVDLIRTSVGTHS